MDENQTNQTVESTEAIVRSGRGGPRKGAGRPSLESLVLKDRRWLAAHANKPLTAALILQHVVNEGDTWRKIFASEDERVLLQAIMYLSDKRDGKATQRVEMRGSVLHVDASQLESALNVAHELRRLLVPNQDNTGVIDAQSGITLELDEPPQSHNGNDNYDVIDANTAVSGDEKAKTMLSGDDGQERVVDRVGEDRA